MNLKKTTLILILLIICLSPSLFAAMYAGEFMTLGVGGKALGMGGAFAAIADDASAGYWNPAGLFQLKKKELLLMHSETFGSLLNHDFISYVIPRKKETSTSAFGFNLMRLGGDGIKITELPNPNLPPSESNKPYVVDEKSHSDYVFSFSYSRKIKPNLALGGNAKLIYRDIAGESAYGLGMDLGILAYLSSSFTLGASLLDASTTFLAYDNGTKESIYPTLKTGSRFSQNFKNFIFTIAFDSDFRFEGRDYAAQLNFEDFSADLHYGVEINYLQKVALRLGSDQGDFTYGFGLYTEKLGADIAFLDHDELDTSYRISLKIKL
ncbi:MAG: PorV/PorQ family protein [Candidatus Zixiibacteriota bacterium]